MPSSFGFTKINHNFERLKRDLPLQIGNMAQNFFRSSFEHQGFTDQGYKPWKEVQRRIPGTKAYKYPKKRDLGRHTRGILIGSGRGHLRQAVNNSLKTATFNEILFSVDVPYAAVHNYGLHSGRGGGFTMPQRKFIGHSETLLHQIDDKIKREVDKLKKGI